MDKIKTWIMAHKAMSVGVAVALALLIYLWISSRGGGAQASGDGGALAAYYGAQGQAAQGAAAQSQSTNELAASTAQTQAARDVALAQVAAAKIPYLAQLEALTQQYNLVAYQDWMAEQSAANSQPSGQQYFLGTNAQGEPILTSGLGGAGELYINPATGERSRGQTAGTWSEIINGTKFIAAVWNGAGTSASPITGGATAVAGQAGLNAPLPYYTAPPKTVVPFVPPFKLPTWATTNGLFATDLEPPISNTYQGA